MMQQSFVLQYFVVVMSEIICYYNEKQHFYQKRRT